MDKEHERILMNRFSEAESEAKLKLWRCLIKSYLQKFFDDDSTIIDIGCGFCEFINLIKGKKKYALDIEEEFKKFANGDVEFLKIERWKSIPIADSTCDRLFASNFLEHLESHEEIKFILREAYRILKPGGRMIVIQPNIALVGGAYWDFFDHLLPLTEKSILEAMEMVGFQKFYLKRRFLPYTTKKHRFIHPLLLKLYLTFPVFQWILGKQSLIVAEKRVE